MEIEVNRSQCAYRLLKLKEPFGFKGSTASFLWTVDVVMRSGRNRAHGNSIQSPLWSDRQIYMEYGEHRSNLLMFSLTEYACRLIAKSQWINPEQLFEYLYEKVYIHACDLLGRKPRKTFVLNALVPIDNAIRMLYCQNMNQYTFDCFSSNSQSLGNKAEALSIIPLVSYNTGLDSIHEMARAGVSVFKIKIGNSTAEEGDYESMLLRDMQRLNEVHSVLSKYTTKYTENGAIAYYLDANGRYDSVKRVQDLLDYTKKIGAFDNILLLEEPFDEENDFDVSSLDILVAADESLHDIKDARIKIDRGYKAFTLKPIAKTISATNKVLKSALDNDIAVFCTDLTATPMLLEINKSYAARLPVFPGMKIGMIESNGAQNYVKWKHMMKAHPMRECAFTMPQDGLFQLDQTFYNSSGGIFKAY